MVVLVVTVIIGVAIALFATQNTDPVTLYFWKYTINEIPIYLVILVSIISTLLIAVMIYITKSLSSSMTIGEKNKELKEIKEEAAELTKHVHKLELENTKLKSKKGIEEEDENAI